MERSSIEKKMMILKYSLRLEKITSLALAFILDIENIEESKSLGNKTSSISFNQKVNLLLDSKSINKEEKIKFDFFMSVRNQFMHNLNVNSFTDAYLLIDGAEKKLRQIYPEMFSENYSNEYSLEKSTEKLYADNMKTLMTFKGARENKLKSIADIEVYKNLYHNTPAAIDRALNELNSSIEKDEFDYNNKEELIENINILKLQILAYQQL